MNKVRERILKEVSKQKYRNLEKYKDLIVFICTDEYFCYNPDINEYEQSDFDDLIIVTEKDWLFDLIKRDNDFRTDEEARRFLQEEYTNDDSSTWYEEAILANKVVMVDFN